MWPAPHFRRDSITPYHVWRSDLKLHVVKVTAGPRVATETPFGVRIGVAGMKIAIRGWPWRQFRLFSSARSVLRLATTTRTSAWRATADAEKLDVCPTFRSPLI